MSEPVGGGVGFSCAVPITLDESGGWSAMAGGGSGWRPELCVWMHWHSESGALRGPLHPTARCRFRSTVCGHRLRVLTLGWGPERLDAGRPYGVSLSPCRFGPELEGSSHLKQVVLAQTPSRKIATWSPKSLRPAFFGVDG